MAQAKAKQSRMRRFLISPFVEGVLQGILWFAVTVFVVTVYLVITTWKWSSY